MQIVLLVVLCLIAYVGGLMLLVRVPPRLIWRTFEDTWFVGLAALIILGAILSYGAVFILLAMFNGAVPVRILVFFFLVGITVVAVRMALLCLRSSLVLKAVKASRFLAGGFCLLLACAGLFSIVQLFVSP